MIYYSNFFTEEEDLVGKIACADALRAVQDIAKEKHEKLVRFTEYDKELLFDIIQTPEQILKLKRLAADEIRQYCNDSTESRHQKEMQEALKKHQHELQDALKKQRFYFVLIGLSLICVVLLTIAILR